MSKKKEIPPLIEFCPICKREAYPIPLIETNTTNGSTYTIYKCINDHTYRQYGNITQLYGPKISWRL